MFRSYAQRGIHSFSIIKITKMKETVFPEKYIENEDSCFLIKRFLFETITRNAPTLMR